MTPVTAGKIDLAEKLAAFEERFSPKTVAIEPRGTVNTGDAGGPLTRAEEEL